MLGVSLESAWLLLSSSSSQESRGFDTCDSLGMEDREEKELPPVQMYSNAGLKIATSV